MATLDSNKVTDVSVVSGASDAANKLYVDSIIDSTVPVSGNAGRFLNVSENLPGLVWYSRTSGLDGNINGVAFGNNYYVAADSTGAVVYSTDTINWVRTTSGFGGSSISSLVYYNNFVAGGSNVINNWTSLNFFEGRFLSTIDVRSVAFGNNRFIAGGSGLSALWTQRTSGFGTSTIFTLMYDGSNYFAAGAGGALTTSTNAVQWTYRTSGTTAQIGPTTSGGNGLLFAVGQTEDYVYAGASGVLATSTDSIHWISRNSATGTTAINAIAYGALPSATYVRANNTAGNIATSTDAVSWTLRTTGDTTNIIQTLLYSTATSEYYVNGRQGGALQTSTDAIHWTLRTSGTTLGIRQLLYGDVYVASGASGLLLTSTNAIQWTLRTSGTAQGINGLAYTSGSYVASADSGVSLYSTNAITWFLRTSGFGTSVIQAVAFGNNVFVNGGVGGALTTSTPTLLSSGGFGARINSSADGIAWTIRTAPLGTENANLLAASSSEYVAHCLDYNGEGGIIIRSTDAVTWVLRTSGFRIRTANALIYSNPFYVIGGDSGNVSWTQRTSGFGSVAINSLTFGNNRYLAGGLGSVDLWTTRTSRITGNTFITAAIFDGSQFLIGASTSGQISSSTDGIVWTLRTSGSAGQIGYTFGGNGFLYVNGATEPYVYSGSAGILATSTNSIEWTLRTSGVTTAISSMAYGTLPSATYVWASTAGALATSTNAIQWTLRTAGTTSTIQALLYSTATSQYYVNCGVGGILQTSTDAITWTLRTSGTTNDLRHLIYGDVYVVIGGPSGSINGIGVVNTSTDAIHWTLRTSGYAVGGGSATSALWCLTYTSGSYFISGGAGSPGSGIPVVLHSTDAIVWSVRTVTGHDRGDFFASAIGNNTYIGGGYNGNPNQAILSSATLTSLINPSTGARIHSSTDTITWTIRTAPPGTLTANLLAASPSDYVAHCLDYNNNASIVINSTDSVTWVLRTSGFSIRTVNALIYGNGYYLLGGDIGGDAQTTWTRRTSGFGAAAINSLTFGNNLYLAGGAGLSALWTQRTSGFGAAAINTFTYDGSLYFAAGAGGTLTTSTDAITWTYRTSGTTAEIGQPVGGSNAGGNGLLYNSGTTEPYVYAGASGVLATSTNGIEWTLRTSGSGTTRITAIAYGALPTPTYVWSNLTAGVLATSTNAIEWTLRTTGQTTTIIQALLYSDATAERYLNCRWSTGIIQSSTDAITWVIRTQPTTQPLYQLIRGGVYVSSASNGVIITSTDAIVWTLRTSGTSAYFIALAYDSTSGSYVAGGQTGVSLYSTDAITWLARTSGFGSNIIYSATFANGVYVQGGQSGTLTTATATQLSSGGFGARIHSSTDAINWTIRTTPTEIETANLLAASSSDYVAHCLTYDGIGGVIINSTDGVNWVLRTSGFSVRTANSFIYGNGYYILGGDVGYAPWTQRTTRYGVAVTPEGATLNINSLTYGNNRYLAGGSSVTAFWILRTSGFGTTTISSVTFGNNLYLAAGANLSILWTQRTSGFGTTAINSLTFGNNLYLAGGLSGASTLWSQRTSGFGTSSIFTMMYDGSNYFAAGAGGTLTTSTNAVQWTYRTSGTTTQIGYATGGNGLLYASGQTEQYVYAGASGVLATSTDSIAWTLRTSPNSTIAIQAIAYGALPSATYVRSTATAGEIATSTNGIEWTLRTTGDTTNIIQELLYSTATSEYYVNVRGGGVIQTSTDAIAWTLRTSGTTTALRQLLYGDVYVVAGDSGVLTTSTNAIQWTLRTSGTTAALYGLAYTAGSYVASGASGVSLYSTDAITWFARTSAFGTSVIQSTVFGNNIFANVGVSGILSTSTPTLLSSEGLGARIYSSTDTITWTVRTVPFGSETANLLASSTSDYVAHCIDYNGLGGVIINSTDGVNWILRTSGIRNFSVRTTNVLIYANGNYLLGGDVGYAPWTFRTSGFGTSSIFTLMYDGSNYFAAGAGGALTTSTNAVRWTYRTSGTIAQLGYATGGTGLLYAAGQTEQYVYAGASGVLATSTDSIVWTLRTSPNSTVAIQALAFGSLPSATYVRSTATAGEIATSTNGIQWTLRTTGDTTNIIQELLYSSATSEYYVNVRGAGVIQTSTDAITWILRTSGTITALRQLLYGDVYVVAGDSGVLNTSTNAIQWTLRTSGTTQALYGLAYTAGSYVASGTSGTSLYSTDAITWVLRTSGFGTSIIQAVTFGNNIFVQGGVGATLTTSSTAEVSTLGTSGLLIASTDSITWSLRTTGSNINITGLAASGSLYVANALNNIGQNQVIVSTDTINWVARTSGFGFTRINTIGYDSVYVAAGNSGFVWSSTDSIVWTLRTSSTAQNINMIAVTSGLYVASGASGANIISTDGIAWMLRTSGFGTTVINAVTFGNNLFVNGGVGGTLTTSSLTTLSSAGLGVRIHSSTDTITWTIRTTPFGTENANLLASSGSDYVAHCLNYDGIGGVIINSTDGVNWVLRTSSISGFSIRTANALIYANGNYLLGGELVYAPWTLRTSGFGTSSIFTMMYDGSNYFAAGAGGTLTTSTNAVQWTYRTSGVTAQLGPSAGGNGLLYVSGATEPYVYAGAAGTLATSTDSIAWTLRTSPNSTSSIQAITYGALPSATYVRSAANQPWVPTPSDPLFPNLWYDASDASTITLSGSNVTTWANKGSLGSGSNLSGSASYTATQNSLNVITCNGNGNRLTTGQVNSVTHIFVASAWSSAGASSSNFKMFLGSNTFDWHGPNSLALVVSSTAAAWVTNQPTQSTSQLDGSNFVNITNNKWTTFSVYSINLQSGFAGGFSGTGHDSRGFQDRDFDGNYGEILVYQNTRLTTDQINFITGYLAWKWGSQSLLPVSHPYKTFAPGSEGFIGEIATSTNAISWILRTTGEVTNNIQALLYSTATSEYYVNVRNSGVIQTSTDAISWTLRTSGTTTTLRQIVYGDVYVVAGDSGVLTTSTNAIQWTLRTTGTTQGISGLAYTSGSYVASGTSGVSLHSTDAVTWLARTSGFGSSAVQAVVFGNNIFVNGGSGGTLATSPTSLVSTLGPGGLLVASTDSITWSLRTTGSNINITGLAASGSLYVASSINNIGQSQIITSTDTINWVSRTSGFGTTRINALSYGNEYVAIANNNLWWASTDSIVWSARTVAFGGTAHNNNKIVFGAGTYTATAPNNSTFSYVSTDSIVWFSRTLSLSSNDLTFGNNIFIAVGTLSSTGAIATQSTSSSLISPGLFGSGARIHSSTDTITWTIRTTPLGAETANLLASSGSDYVAHCLTYDGIGGIIINSTDAVNWVLRTSGFSEVSGFTLRTANSLIYANNYYLLGGTTGYAPWTLRTSGFGTSSIFTMMYDGSNYFAAGAGGTLTTSTNTIQWTYRTSGVTAQLGNASGGNGLLYVSGATEPYIYAGIGAPGVLATSTDSIVWTLRTSPTAAAIQAITYGALPSPIYVRANAAGGDIATSTNAIQWTLRTTGEISTAIQALLYSTATTEYYVNVRAAGGIIQTSTDAIAWTTRTSGTTAALRQLLYGDVYVVAGDSGVLNTSTNAIQWTLRTSGTAQALYGIAYTAGSYVVSGASGTSLYSTDAITWFLRTSGFGTSVIQAVTFGNNVFVNGGVGGVLTTSTPTVLRAGLGTGALLSVSTDTITWTLRTTGENISVTALTASNTLYVANVLNNINQNQVIVSTDTINWILRTSGFGNTTINTLGYDTTYVAAGNSGFVWSSTDSIVWTLRTSGTTQNLNSISVASGAYIASGAAGVNIASTDAITWFLRTSGFGTSVINAVTFGNNLFVNGGVGGTLTTSTLSSLATLGPGGLLVASTDAVTWRLRTTGANVNVTALTTSGALYVANTLNNINQNQVIVSTDTINWVSRTSGFGFTRINALSYESISGIYVAAGNSGFVWSSTDSIVWTLRTSSTPQNLNAVSSTSGLYAASGAAGVNIASTDAITWFLRTSGFGTSVINAVTFGNNLFVNGGVGGTLTTSSSTILPSLGPGGLLVASTDAITWILRTTGSNVNITALTSDGSLFVANAINTLNENRVLVSTDTITWTDNAQIGFTRINALGYDTFYVAVGNSGVAWSSTNTIVWILRTSTTAQNLNGIASASGTYVASGAAGTSLVSGDGIVWGTRTSGFGSSAINAVTFGNGLFVNGGVGGTLTVSSNPALGAILSTSTNGTQWVLRTAVANSRTITALAANNTFYIANIIDHPAVNQIMVSTNAIHWTARTSGFGSTQINALTTGGIYIAAGNSGFVWSSTDSIAWVLRTSGFGTSNITSLSYTPDGAYLAGSAGGNIRSSSDGIHWFLRTSGTTNQINSFANSATRYVAGGAAGTLLFGDSRTLSYLGNGGLVSTSTNGIQWTLRTTCADIQSTTVLIAGGSFYIGAGTNYLSQSVIIASTDSINWVLRTTPFGTTVLNALEYHATDNYTVAGNTGILGTSTDSFVWILRTSAFGTNAITALAHNQSNLYVAGGASGILNTSSDGISWVLRTSGFGTSQIFSLAYETNGGYYIAASAGGAIRTSTNAIVWEIRTSPTTNQLNAISNSGGYNGFYLIGGNSRTLLASSTDTTQIKWALINATNSGL